MLKPAQEFYDFAYSGLIILRMITYYQVET